MTVIVIHTHARLYSAKARTGVKFFSERTKKVMSITNRCNNAESAIKDVVRFIVIVFCGYSKIHETKGAPVRSNS